MADQQLHPSAAAATLKPCDTIPAPQNLAVRVRLRQPEGHHFHHNPASVPSSPPTDRTPGALPGSAGQSSSTGTPAAARSDISSHNSPLTNDSISASIIGNTSINESDNFIEAVRKIANPTPVSPPRHLCMRHKRTADEGTNLKLGQVRSPPPNTPFSIVSDADSHPFTRKIGKSLMTLMHMSGPQHWLPPI